MQIVFRPEAERELLEARNWYEARSPQLGLEFAQAVDAAITRIAEMPLSFPRIEADIRHVPVRKFPYSIIYSVNAFEIVVVSCFHHRRNPDTWRRNLGE